MNRTIPQPGSIVLVEDVLSASRNAMISDGALAHFTLGAGPWLDGFACVPTAPAGLSVIVGNGTLSTLGVVDASDYGVLAADGHPLVKVFSLADATPLAIGGAGTWTVQAQAVESDDLPAVLQYVNAANPAQALSGPSGNATSQFTRRSQLIVISVVAGSAAAAGCVPMYQVVVPQGATAIDGTMLARAPGAPFVDLKLPFCAPLDSPFFTGDPRSPDRPAGDSSYSHANTRFVTTAIAALTQATAQQITQVTENVTNLGTAIAQDLTAYTPLAVYNPAVASLSDAVAGLNSGLQATEQSLSALSAYAHGIRPGMTSAQAFGASGIFTVPDTITRLWTEGVGAGGGSSGSDPTQPGAGGGGGGYVAGFIDVMPGQQIPIVVGTGGGAAVPYAQAGTGGTTSIGSYMAATGGQGGNSVQDGPSAGGAGGTGYGPSALKIGSGGDGADGYAGNGWLAGTGGNSFFAGNARAGTAQNGQGLPGLYPGGGAAGVYGSAANGADGADGFVVVYW